VGQALPKTHTNRWRPPEAAIGVLREGLSRARGAPAGSAARKRLSPRAQTYLASVIAAALAAATVSALDGNVGRGGWGLGGVLLALATLAQLFIVEKPGSQSYRMAVVFLLASALFLSPAAVAAIATLHYVPSWFRHRRSWHVRAFNVGCTVLSALSAWAVYHQLVTSGRGSFALAGLAAAASFVVVNHTLLAVMIRLATSTPLGATGLFSLESLSTDSALAALGVGVVVVWNANPWTLAFAIAPLFLIYRALHVPQLEVEARIDPKTGLLNAREFEAAFAHELERAQRSVSPLSLLMLDLDFLRDINNTYGHLAGDAVIRAIADTLREELRHGDVASRFGGEEFAVLLPGGEHDAALQVAERIRSAFAARAVEDETADVPLRATLSIGVATYPWHGRTAKELISEADAALYRAKEFGRNRVVGVGASLPPTPHLTAVN